MKKYLLAFLVLVALSVSAFVLHEHKVQTELQTEIPEDSTRKSMFDIAEERAETGDSYAMFLLGYLYSEGIHTEIDTVKSKYWLDMAIEHDNPEAMFYAAFESKHYNASVDEMIDLCKRGAKLGDYCCMQALAMFYGAGIDGKPDMPLFYYWMEEAAKAGNTEAMYSVGLFYFAGDGVEENHKTAMEWFKKGTDKWSDKCMLGLAEGYLYGDGIAIDRAKGVDWAKKSAALGNKDAFVFVAELYDKGIGVEKDKEISKKLYKASDYIKSDKKDEALHILYALFPELEQYAKETTDKIANDDVLVKYIEKLGFKRDSTSYQTHK